MHDHQDHHDHPEVTVAKSPMIADNTVISIKIPWEEAHQAYKNAVVKEGKNVKVAGFRKGKMPANLVEQAVGKERIVLTAINSLLPKKYPAALEKSGKKPISYPDFVPVSLEWGKEWQVDAHVAEEPEIKLGDYKKIIKNAQKEALKEIEKIEKELAAEAKKAAKDAKDAKVETDLKAKPTSLTDQQKKDKTLETVIKNLVTSVKPAIPELLVKQQAHNELHHLEQQLGQIGMKIDAYMERRGVTQENLMHELTSTALAQLQTDFILLALTRAEKIEVTESEVLEKLGDKAKEANAEVNQMVKNTLQRQKLVEFLLN